MRAAKSGNTRSIRIGASLGDQAPKLASEAWKRRSEGATLEGVGAELRLRQLLPPSPDLRRSRYALQLNHTRRANAAASAHALAYNLGNFLRNSGDTGAEQSG